MTNDTVSMPEMLAQTIVAEAYREVHQNSGVRVLRQPYGLVCTEGSFSQEPAAAVFMRCLPLPTPETFWRLLTRPSDRKRNSLANRPPAI
jgi:hypothetical protein